MGQFFESIDKEYLNKTFPRLSDELKFPLQPVMIQAMLAHCDGSMWTDDKFEHWIKTVYNPEMDAILKQYMAKSE